MKKLFLFAAGVLGFILVVAQTYPDPEFINEICYLKKDKAYSLMRLEKNSAKQETKVNMIKGSEFGYAIEGKSSSVRLSNGSNLSFIFSTGTSLSSSNSKSDSVMRSNGIDPNMMNFMNPDPSNIILYKLNVDGGDRKIYLQKTGGYFGSHKNQSSDKYTFSIKKIKDGYWELVIDKTLTPGEYGFSMTSAGVPSTDGSMVLFLFGID